MSKDFRPCKRHKSEFIFWISFLLNELHNKWKTFKNLKSGLLRFSVFLENLKTQFKNPISTALTQIHPRCMRSIGRLPSLLGRCTIRSKVFQATVHVNAVSSPVTNSKFWSPKKTAYMRNVCPPPWHSNDKARSLIWLIWSSRRPKGPVLSLRSKKKTTLQVTVTRWKSYLKAASSGPQPVYCRRHC